MRSICTRRVDAFAREAAGKSNCVGERLAGLQLVCRRTRHLADDANARLMHGHENDVSVQETHVARRVAVDEIVVDVERLDRPAGAPDLDVRRLPLSVGPRAAYSAVSAVPALEIR